MKVQSSQSTGEQTPQRKGAGSTMSTSSMPLEAKEGSGDYYSELKAGGKTRTVGREHGAGTDKSRQL